MSERMPRVIAIDGPAGAGKTTVGIAVAAEFGYLFVDTGAFYRAVTLAALRAGATDSDQVIAAARIARLNITGNPVPDGRHYTVLLDDEDVTWAIRSAEVEGSVSWVSAIGAVREILNARYRELAAERGQLIMAGRDIGTVVLPEADLKIYLDASLAVRAERRVRQTGLLDVVETEVAAALAERDRLDSQRDVAPLRIAPGAHYIDTDALGIDAVIARIASLIRNWQPADRPDSQPESPRDSHGEE